MYEKKTVSGRQDWIDILKVSAILSVIVLHYTSYYFTPCSNAIKYILLNTAHWFSFQCIGFFIIATGYLNCNKTAISVKFYKKIVPVIITFFFSVLLTVVFLHPYDGTKPIFRYFKEGVDYYFWGFHGYYWYMGFYIAFYMLIPFINIVISNISQKEHIILIVILITLLSGPQFFQYLEIIPSQ